MSSAVAVNNSSTGKTPLHKVIALGLVIFGVIEALVAYFLVIGPLYITPVYNQADSYNEQGITCIVKFFGKTFASADEVASNQVILSLFSTVINIVLIYLIFTGIMLILAFCFSKGFAFAKSYLIAVFGGKAIIGIVPLLVPLTNVRNSMKIFGAVDAVICFALCIYFVYLGAVEYADDMLMSNEEVAQMKTRGIHGGIMFLILALTMIFESMAMGALGNGTWSIHLGWLSETQIQQGVVLALLTAIGIVAAITYVRGADWGEFFFFSFGLSVAVSDLVGIVSRILWIFRTYKPQKALANSGDETAAAWISSNGMTASWWRKTIFLIIAFVGAAALAAFAFKKIQHKLVVKMTAEDKKPVTALIITTGSLVLCFVLTLVAVLLWDKQLYGAITLGAMDYMYYVVYGGITIFLITSMIGGFSFTKFGTLALFIVVLASDFECIFEVFSARSSYIAANPGLKGYNYIIAAVLFILAIISCFGIISAFVVKEFDNYLYNKRYN